MMMLEGANMQAAQVHRLTSSMNGKTMDLRDLRGVQHDDVMDEVAEQMDEMQEMMEDAMDDAFADDEDEDEVLR